jgi:chaperone required for assembly of F1-ATPase
VSEWKAKRFWKDVTVAPVAEGYAVRLDGRPVRSPAKSEVVTPTAGLAERIAGEWREVEEIIDPRTMPYTRAANAALDKVTAQRAEVAEMLAEYGASDLLCYRAESPDELVARQNAAWDPLLDWAAEAHGARLVPTTGVMFAAQDAAALARLRAPVVAMSPWQLTALHDLVALSGSLVIALAVVDRVRAPEAAWDISRIDELWQIEQWGEDEEAAEIVALKRQDFLRAADLWRLVSEADD